VAAIAATPAYPVVTVRSGAWSPKTTVL